MAYNIPENMDQSV
uniref:Uncharacterized protein n=1 Tax=Rhizophora mucronata TaxID=61149 RepID=A0A2P2J242_RHIMU